MKQQRNDSIFTVVIILIHAVFFLLALQFKKIYNGDSFEYIQEAINIKEHFFFYSGNPALPIKEEYLTLRTPVYPLFLALIYTVSMNNWIVLFIQNLISVFNVLYFRKNMLAYTQHPPSGEEFPKRPSKIGWGFVLLFIIAFPIQFIYANTIAPDILLQTFVLVYFHHALLFFKKKTSKHAVYMSIALVIGLSIKPVLYPFSAIHLLLLLSYAVYHKISFRRVFLSAMLPVFCILLYNYWNYTRSGKFHFSSIQSFNAIYYYHNYFSDKNGVEQGRKFITAEREKISSMPSFPQRYDYANERGMELLKQELFPYMKYHLKKSFLFFLEPGKGEIDLFTGKLSLGNLYAEKTKGFTQSVKEDGARGMLNYLRNNPSTFISLVILLFNFLKLIGLFLFIFYARAKKIMKWFVVLFLLYFALITGPISAAHYTLPISLILIGVALTGYQSFLQRKQNNSIITST